MFKKFIRSKIKRNRSKGHVRICLTEKEIMDDLTCLCCEDLSCESNKKKFDVRIYQMIKLREREELATKK